MKEVIFENGTVAYVGKGQSFQMQGPDGGSIPIVAEHDLGKLPVTAQDTLHEANRTMIAEPHKHGWRTRQMTLQEQVDRKILTSEEAETIARQQKRKH